MILTTKDQKEIFFKTYGESKNPAMVLIHGIGADHRMFEPQIERFAEAGYFIILPDMRGHGKSAKVSSLELEDWVRDIEELLVHLDLQKVIMIGVSMGGVIAQKFVVKNPEKVKKIIITDSFGELKSLMERTIGLGQVFGFKLFHYLPGTFTAKLLGSTYQKLSKATAKYFQEVSLNIDYQQLVLARKAINKIDILSELKPVEVPALVLVGDQVKLMVPVNEKIANSLKNSSFRVLKGSMDPSNLVVPEDFNREVLNFLENK